MLLPIFILGRISIGGLIQVVVAHDFVLGKGFRLISKPFFMLLHF